MNPNITFCIYYIFLGLKCSIPHLYLEVYVLWVWEVLQAPEWKVRERSAWAPLWLLTGSALCGGLFPAFTGNAHIGNRFSLTVDICQSPAKTTLSCCSLQAEKRGRDGEGGQLWNSFPSSNRVWGISFIILSVLRSHIFSLAFFQSPHEAPAFSSSLRARVSVLSAVWFFKCQHTGACPGRGVTPAWAAQWGPMWAQDLNVNTACDTPSQHTFKPSNRGS